MPLARPTTRMINSKFADMKNVGGRPQCRLDHRGAVPQALSPRTRPGRISDIAGTGMSAPQSEINRSFGSGWGVRLLDRLMRDHYEG